ncbi:hypothetical protein [Halorussus lipolyticus]|uniref:hypothetical protein n=1 Tax=Halorussus lipolyticus TaxID=3034024 RepID=UPI0023E77089|nr:hypothetical protein [Halorussus sp. DT80]
MDVLKDITDGLRRGDDAETEEDRTPEENRNPEEDRGEDERDETPETEGAEERKSTTDRAGATADRTDGALAGDSSAPAGFDREEVHVCSFCEAEFDAGRDACPECDAKIVIRGAR